MNWIAVVIAGLATWASRVSFIFLGDRVSLPPIAESALRYVGPAAFAAISIPIVLGGDAFANFDDDVPRIIAASLACFVVWKSRNLPLSLVTGMGTLWLLIWVL